VVRRRAVRPELVFSAEDAARPFLAANGQDVGLLRTRAALRLSELAD